jgi:hypothetical protein
MFCPKCGGKNDEDGKFCDQCGTGLFHNQTTAEESKKFPGAIIASVGAVILGLIFVIILFASKGGNENGRGDKGGGSVRGSTNVNEKAFIDNVIKPLYVCCKDSCFTATDFPSQGRREYTEYKGDSDVTVIFEPRDLDEADKLNGVEWDGRVLVVSGKASRRYESGGWTDWEGLPPPRLCEQGYY